MLCTSLLRTERQKKGELKTQRIVDNELFPYVKHLMQQCWKFGNGGGHWSILETANPNKFHSKPKTASKIREDVYTVEVFEAHIFRRETGKIPKCIE